MTPSEPPDGSMYEDAPTSLAAIACRVDADFEPALHRGGVRFLTYDEWLTARPHDTSSTIQGTADELVCVFGGRSFVVSLTGGAEAAIATIAGALQDEVMDETNSPWPWVASRGVVLEPHVDECGLAVWSSPDGAVRCPVGYLKTALEVGLA